MKPGRIKGIDDALLEFTSSGNLHALRSIADSLGPVINTVFPNGTALNIACKIRRLDIFDFLMGFDNIDVSLANNVEGTWPLYSACQCRPPFAESLVRRLLRVKGIQVNMTTPALRITALSAAIERENLAVMKILLYDPRVDPNGSDEEDLPPLAIAARYKSRLLIFQTLLGSEKINVNKAGKSGKTALMIACENNNTEAIKLLLERKEIEVGLLFSLVVYVSDGYYHVTPPGEGSDRARRFFNSTKGLPLELQMIIANRSYGLARDVVLSKHSEEGFKRYAKNQEKYN